MEAVSAKRIGIPGPQASAQSQASPRASPRAIKSLVDRWGLHESKSEDNSNGLHSSTNSHLGVMHEEQKAWQQSPDPPASGQLSDVLLQERLGRESSLHADYEQVSLGRPLLEKLEGLPEALNMAKDALVAESVKIQTELWEFMDLFEQRIVSRLDAQKHDLDQAKNRLGGTQQGHISDVLKDEDVLTDKAAEEQGVGAIPLRQPPETFVERMPASPLSLRSHIDSSIGIGATSHTNRSVVETIVEKIVKPSPPPGRQTRWTHIVESDLFHFTTATFILLNTLMLGVQTDFEVRNAMESQGSDYDWFSIVNLVFLVFFSVELLLRILAEQQTFVTGEYRLWNLLDTLLVGTAIVEEFAVDMGVNFTNFRVTRVIRMLKTMRVLRVFSFFRDLRIMVSSVLMSFRSLTWALFLMTLLIFCFAVLFCQGVTVFAESDSYRNSNFDSELEEFYGSLSKSMFTLVMAISGGKDWYDLVVPLGEVSHAYAGVFVVYILFVMFGMLNVLTGVFCDRASELSNLDRDLIVEAEKFKAERTRILLQTVFREADTDDSGLLSWTEFEQYAGRPDVQQLFSTMDMPIEETKEVFQMFDRDRKGKVPIDAFVNGCMRLKGQAKNLDILHMIDAIEEVNKKLTHVDRNLTLLISNGASSYVAQI